MSISFLLLLLFMLVKFLCGFQFNTTGGTFPTQLIRDFSFSYDLYNQVCCESRSQNILLRPEIIHACCDRMGTLLITLMAVSIHSDSVYA